MKEFRSTFHSRSERISPSVWTDIFRFPCIFRHFAIIILCTYEKGKWEKYRRGELIIPFVHSKHRFAMRVSTRIHNKEIKRGDLGRRFSLSFLILIWRWASFAGCFFFMGSRMYIAAWRGKMSGVTGARKFHSLRLRTFLHLFPLSIDATEINAYWDWSGWNVKLLLRASAL